MSSDTTQTVGAIAFVGLLVIIAGLSSRTGNGKIEHGNQLLFFWLIFDALIHFFRTYGYVSDHQWKAPLFICRYLDAPSNPPMASLLMCGKNIA